MRAILTLLILLVTTHLWGQTTVQEHYTAAVEAYNAKDYGKFSTHIRKADDLRPNHPAIVPKVAAAWALTGRKVRSIQKLSQLMLMDATFDFVNNPDFDNIRDYKGYDKLLELQKRLGTVEEHDEVFMTIDAANLHPESFAILDNGEIILGSVREKKLVRVDGDGNVNKMLDTDYSVLGMKLDNERNHLWVSTAAMPEMVGYEESEAGNSIILQVDLSTGDIVQGIKFDEESIIGDIVLDEERRIWISNSMQPVLSRDETDTAAYLGAFNRLTFDLIDSHFSLQGLCMSEDQKYLYFADYINGIHRVNIEEGRVEKIFAPKTSLLKGIDGLYWYKNSLIAIHNGTKPYRVVQYFLNETGLTIDLERVINRGGPSLGEPTLGQVKDGYFYYLANSPWPFYDKDKNLMVDQLKPIEIRRIKLD